MDLQRLRGGRRRDGFADERGLEEAEPLAADLAVAAAKRLGIDLTAYVILSVSERMRRDDGPPCRKKKRDGG